MKFLVTLTSVLALGTVAADAADVYVDDTPVVVEAPVEDLDRFYVEARFGYGPALLDLDVETGSALGGLIPETAGEIESDFLVGGALEAGYFLNEWFRIGVEGGIGYLDNDRLDLDADVLIAGGAGGVIQDADLDGGATIYQGFVKAAVEVPVAHDIGFARKISVFGTAGVGLLHLDLDVTQENGGANNNSVLDDDDTVLAGKVGIGVATQLTDHISLVTEANYIFGEDGEFTTVTATGTEIDTRIETEALTLQTGIRIRF